MEWSEFGMRPCKNRLAFDVVPRQRLSLDWQTTCQRLRANGLEVEAETPRLVLVRVQGKPVCLYPDGRFQVRQARDAVEAKAVAVAVIGCL
ncbi:MAG TPA: hypothetical protein HA252_03385 [Candidatus Diapherotrites archaeon]|uniref:Uncharacterized protein n=1 Tax=Candidatus Iainarchaeum sp. TaxID=3101447 RepID=A0A7J4JF71_9ARCH|nr:hypothetical protein [Candidatus Diapherotrites archaeon]HIH16422.1 hypothetical protein [Candidatus Diapherotrites archaeon]